MAIAIAKSATRRVNPAAQNASQERTMRIACPACAATYEVPAGMLAVGQRVACARCGKDWVPLSAAAEPSSDIAIPAAPSGPEPSGTQQRGTAPPSPPPVRTPSYTANLAEPLRVASPDRPLPSAAEPTRPDWFPRVSAEWSSSDHRSPLVPLAWASSIAVLLALLSAGIAARDGLMAQWPPASRLFSALGLDDR